MATTNTNISSRINKIFEENQITDLKKFMKKRQSINNCNLYMMYLFYFIQSAGILTTTIATGYNRVELIWVGVGLNIFASLIHVYEQNNNAISQRLLKDIKLIKNNEYVDEDILIDLDDTPKNKNNNTSINMHQNDNSSSA